MNRKRSVTVNLQVLITAALLGASGTALAKSNGTPGDVAELREDVDANTVAISENGAAIAANSSAIGANQSGILANAAGIATNANDIANNAQQVQTLFQGLDEVNTRAIDNTHRIAAAENEIDLNAIELGRTNDDIDIIDGKIAELNVLLQSAGEMMLALEERTDRMNQYSRATRRWVRAMAAAREHESRLTDTNFIYSALLNGEGPEQLPGTYWALWIERAMDIVEFTRCHVDDEDGLYPSLDRGDLDCVLSDGTPVAMPEGAEDGVILSREETAVATHHTVVTMEWEIENAMTELENLFAAATDKNQRPACRDYMIRFYDIYGAAKPDDNDQGQEDSYWQCVSSYQYSADQVYAMKATLQNTLQESMDVITIGGDDGTKILDECEKSLVIDGEYWDNCAAEEAALVDQWETIEVKGEKDIEKTTDCQTKFHIFGWDGNGCTLNDWTSIF
ncbi:hypothetical protein F3N42_00930 [Marinihelvus fidelis]|uniref:Uncharacterized protein n=1 Tax=Marinihelvus fidelis TaxID=2613842 RepID=A0A5N0TGG4_9GAMM|nr:hypothetical protein [Marinihelvus fidelis]KAA9134140.1 hypothetical protein F3N42_00930 [Marinihelvus fidelis]